jgi:hypothetical protein
MREFLRSLKMIAETPICSATSSALGRSGFFSRDDRTHLRHGFVEDLVEEDRVAAARRELLPLALVGLAEHEAEWHVFDGLGDRLLHLREHALQLVEVQLLLGADDVEDAIGMERRFAVERGGEVARVVERRAVAFAQQARLLDAEFLEPDDLRAVVCLRARPKR